MKRTKQLKYFLLALLAGAMVTFQFGFSKHERKSDGRTHHSVDSEDPATQNLLRAMQLADKAVAAHFTGDGMAMGRFYNPYTNELSREKASVWMYTASIEAVNAILHGLKAQKEHGNTALYDAHFDRYVALLKKLYDNAAYYLGTFKLVSFTQTKEWTVYAVDRAREKGKANVTGILNVYDDQMWLAREFLEAYKLTGDKEYLKQAEYLTEYVLDGWDTTLDANGEENGGIPWGPGYVTKHSCSNGPIISPLVWLHELYKGKSDRVEHRYIDPKDKKTRKSKKVKKSDYYLDFAKKVYDWQKKHLLRTDGVYADMMGDCGSAKCKIVYETVKGVEYRANTPLLKAVGAPYTYNSGTMLSGAADLYRVSKDPIYLADAKALSDASFNYFAKLDVTVPGLYAYDTRGFRNWFNGVLMRGYLDVYPSYGTVARYIDSFQQNLDYGYGRFLHNGFLPTNVLAGWDQETDKNNVEGMFTFTFAAQYALLSQYTLTK